LEDIVMTKTRTHTDALLLAAAGCALFGDGWEPKMYDLLAQYGVPGHVYRDALRGKINLRTEVFDKLYCAVDERISELMHIRGAVEIRQTRRRCAHKLVLTE
jgi:hypothetical protein